MLAVIQSGVVARVQTKQYFRTLNYSGPMQLPLSIVSMMSTFRAPKMLQASVFYSTEVVQLSIEVNSWVNSVWSKLFIYN
jgi:hypothetical protein